MNKKELEIWRLGYEDGLELLPPKLFREVDRESWCDLYDGAYHTGVEDRLTQKQDNEQ